MLKNGLLLVVIGLKTSIVSAKSDSSTITEPTVVYAEKDDSMVGCTVDLNGYYYNLLPLSLEL
jgi:hypothetical protein